MLFPFKYFKNHKFMQVFNVFYITQAKKIEKLKIRPEGGEKQVGHWLG